MLPLEYFRRRAFSSAGGVAFLFSFALIGSVFWIAQMLQVGMGYSPLPLVLAGIGISFVFPTLANAAVGSVPLADSEVAAGSNNTMRETGGLFGVAVLAAVFTANGSYASPTTFMHGLKFAIVAAAVAALVAMIPALLGPSRARALASVGDGNPILAQAQEAAEAKS